MKRERCRRLAILLAVLALMLMPNMAALADTPVVRAVLFFSPTCGHCHYVITEVLPPLMEQYGDQLQIVGVSTATTGGQLLYSAAVEQFDVPAARRGVPALFLDNIVLVGSNEIPERLPGLIEQYLAAGGIGWPDIPGLMEAMQMAESTPEATSEARIESTAESTVEATAESTLEPDAVVAPSAPPDSPMLLNSDTSGEALGVLPPGDSASDDLISRLQRDPAGNALSVLLMVGMLAVVGYVLRRLWLEGARSVLLAHVLTGWRERVVAAFCLVGLGVSIYMAYVEITHAAAVCGPIGDCNTVQQSSYARLFGVLPVGVLGIAGYAMMLVAWAGRQWGQGQVRDTSAVALFGMALFGTLFSIYLTFLEPFVIGATCIWCLTSGLSITLVLLALAGEPREPAKRAGRKAIA